MFGFITKIVVLGVALHYIIEYRDWLEWEIDSMLSVKPGPCRYIIEDGGSEDLTYIDDNIVLLSTGIGSVGAIKAYNTSNGMVETLSIKEAPQKKDFLRSPHGLSAWKNPKTGETFLYIITHPETADSVEVFQVMYSPLSLKYIRSITDSNFRFMNDLVVVDRDKFYITKFSHYRDHLKQQLEILSKWKSGKIYFYDGYKAREVVSGLTNPNGINISPDKRVIYMAEWGSKHLVAYRRESTNNLVEIWNTDVDTGIDNIEVDSVTGDLWIGSHPITWRTLDLLNLLNVNHASQVLRVKMVDNAISEVEEILSDDGDFVAGTSAATYVNGELIVGTVFKQALACNVTYLSSSRETRGHVDSEVLPNSYVPK
ncbi:hypothetical protein ACF0H5_004849 [Mactra antiquata]